MLPPNHVVRFVIATLQDPDTNLCPDYFSIAFIKHCSCGNFPKGVWWFGFLLVWFFSLMVRIHEERWRSWAAWWLESLRIGGDPELQIARVAVESSHLGSQTKSREWAHNDMNPLSKPGNPTRPHILNFLPRCRHLGPTHSSVWERTGKVTQIITMVFKVSLSFHSVVAPFHFSPINTLYIHLFWLLITCF